MKNTLAQAMTTNPDPYAVTMADNGWHLAERIIDHALLLVSTDGQNAYVFRESLLGTANQTYAQAVAS